MHMVIFSTKGHQFGIKVRAHLSHDPLGSRQHRMSEHATAVLGHEHQMKVKLCDYMPALAYIGVYVHDTKW